eukprot:6172428-Pleurochrysis_carterae.AAC.10
MLAHSCRVQARARPHPPMFSPTMHALLVPFLLRTSKPFLPPTTSSLLLSPFHVPCWNATVSTLASVLGHSCMNCLTSLARDALQG